VFLNGQAGLGRGLWWLLSDGRPGLRAFTAGLQAFPAG